MYTRKLDLWDTRLLRGFAATGVREEARAALLGALGALGCEAEFGLSLLHVPAALPRPTAAQGEQWLRQVLGLCQRLTRLGGDLEIATQSYLTALRTEPARPGPRVTHTLDSWGERFDATPGVWWPERGAIALEAEPTEIWLRRAGYALRHSVSVGLPEHLEALENTLALALHALQTLPPSGVLSRESVAISLTTLSSEVQGDLLPHHVRDLDSRHIGLLTGIPTLARLRAGDHSGIEGDLAWARGELARARARLERTPASAGRATRPLTRPTNKLWERQFVTEWERTLAALEAIRAADGAKPAR